MIITLKNANFSASNIGATTTWKIIRNLGNVTGSSDISEVDKGSAYSETFTIGNYFNLKSSYIKMGNVDITNRLTWNNKTGTLNIDSVTGNLYIDIHAESNYNVYDLDLRETDNFTSGYYDVKYALNSNQTHYHTWLPLDNIVSIKMVNPEDNGVELPILFISNGALSSSTLLATYGKTNDATGTVTEINIESILAANPSVNRSNVRVYVNLFDPWDTETSNTFKYLNTITITASR